MSQSPIIPSHSTGVISYHSLSPTLHMRKATVVDQLAIARAITCACGGIRDDMASVGRDYPCVPTEPDAREIYAQFVGSVIFQVELLFLPALDYVQRCQRKCPDPVVQSPLGEVKEGLEKVKELIPDWTKNLAAEQLDQWEQGVPTAFPHQLACHLRILKQDVTEVLNSEREDTATLCKCIAPKSLPSERAFH